MRHNAIISAIQSIAVVAGSAAVGFSLTKVPGGEDASPLLMVLGGAIVGLVGVVVVFMFRVPVEDFERRSSPRQLIGLRIATVGFIVAITGWLVAVFVSGAIGYWVAVVGVLGGGAGIVIHRINLLRAAK